LGSGGPGGGGSSGFPIPSALASPGGTGIDTTGIPSVTITFVAPPVIVSRPQISGLPTEGNALSSSPGKWQGNPLSISYQWQRCAATCANIPGAVRSSYKLQALDVGVRIRAVVTASNNDGSTLTTSTSLGPVAPSVAHVKRWLRAQIVPSGRGAAIPTVRKAGGYHGRLVALTDGTLTVSWVLTDGPRWVLVASGHARVPETGKATLQMRLTSRGVSLLSGASALKLTARGTFKHPGMAAIATTASFTLRN
jgi:hypothetical protein